MPLSERIGARYIRCARNAETAGWEGEREGDARRGERQQRGTQVNTERSALCAVSEPEASPYCVSPRVAFVSVFVGPDHFLPLRSSSPPLRPLPSPRYALLF